MDLVFDFGAVLFTWQPRELVRRHFPALSAQPQQAAALAHALFGHADWHAFDRGVLSQQEVSLRSAQRLGLDPDALFAMVDAIAGHLQPIAETRAVLERLHQRRQLPQRASPRLGLYYLSNMPQPYARALQARHDFLAWFDGGIFSSDVGHIKPEPAIYRLLQQRHALVPEQTVLIDDLEANLQAARSLGWHGIRFESASQLQAQLDGLGR